MLARSATRPRHRNAGRPPEKSAASYLQWLRGRPCRLQGYSVCFGKVRAAHVDCAGGKGVSTKVADCHAIPLCDGHHDEQHSRGWTTFQALYALDAVADAAEFWRQWPGRIAWEKSRAE